MRLRLMLLLAALAGCDDAPAEHRGPTPLFAVHELTELVEVVPCRHSHEHDLRHVRIFADVASGRLWDRCVRRAGGCTEPFPEGARFVKLEYDRPGGCAAGDCCTDEHLVSYTVSLRLAEGALPEGHDWHWQRLDPDLKVTDDGAPPVCIGCHVDHCSPPYGHDLRCTPD